ncbi:hypothetical protein GCM10012280_66380 [Wenjunlia tyrosinilytica]|uniref:Uncharacterized protein n=1 Tax=Wenjunlia tyrosinilytica TaxID=1544741 RepID=A0A917ZWT9_9ACTN|nr:hypothetical protein GCM10012280_66380 [Wenjunlia tyrosinilytica]
MVVAARNADLAVDPGHMAPPCARTDSSARCGSPPLSAAWARVDRARDAHQLSLVPAAAARPSPIPSEPAPMRLEVIALRNPSVENFMLSLKRIWSYLQMEWDFLLPRLVGDDDFGSALSQKS